MIEKKWKTGKNVLLQNVFPV